MNKGILYAAGAYILWGLLPLYWKALHDVPSSQIVAHRLVWSLVFVGLVLTARRNWGWLGKAIRRPRVLLIFGLSGTLLTVNWLVYIWGVNAGFIVETSLGYFINPLVNVLLGYLFLKERLRPMQWGALAVALAGVLYLTFSYGAFPWIALTLAFSFGTLWVDPQDGDAQLGRRAVRGNGRAVPARARLPVVPRTARQRRVRARGRANDPAAHRRGRGNEHPPDPLRRRGAAGHHDHPRPAAIHRPDDAVPHRRADLWRAVWGGAGGGVWVDLVGAAALHV
jgi:uncharacterized membrane protein